MMAGVHVVKMLVIVCITQYSIGQCSALGRVTHVPSLRYLVFFPSAVVVAVQHKTTCCCRSITFQ